MHLCIRFKAFLDLPRDAHVLPGGHEQFISVHRVAGKALRRGAGPCPHADKGSLSHKVTKSCQLSLSSKCHSNSRMCLHRLTAILQLFVALYRLPLDVTNRSCNGYRRTQIPQYRELFMYPPGASGEIKSTTRSTGEFV